MTPPDRLGPASAPRACNCNYANQGHQTDCPESGLVPRPGPCRHGITGGSHCSACAAEPRPSEARPAKPCGSAEEHAAHLERAESRSTEGDCEWRDWLREYATDAVTFNQYEAEALVGAAAVLDGAEPFTPETQATDTKGSTDGR